MKVVIYARVSTRDKQDINTQIDFLTDYAERNELNIIEIYKDIGESGSKDSRPAFDRMLFDMRSRMFDSILVYKLDRIGRSVQHLIGLFEEFNRKNIQFVSATQNINTTTPEGKLFLRMLMVLAEYERELTISRINDGLKRARNQGKTLGRPKGKKDSKPRRKSGYHLRWANSK